MNMSEIIYCGLSSGLGAQLNRGCDCTTSCKLHCRLDSALYFAVRNALHLGLIEFRSKTRDTLRNWRIDHE